jgi:hypothetical protein
MTFFVTRLRTDTHRWAVGVFCAIVGALTLIVPEQFGYLPSLVQPDLIWLGAGFLLAGAGLIASAALQLTRAVTVGSLLLAGASLLVLAVGLVTNGSTTGVISYGLLTFGTVVATILPDKRWATDAGADLFTLTIAANSIAVGATFLALVDHVQSPVFVASPGLHPLFGVLFFGGGLALLYVEIFPTRRETTVTAHLAVAATYVIYAALLALPTRAWTGMMYYGGFGILLALIPWVGPIIQHVDPRSIRTRLALTLVAAACLPLLVTEAVSTQQSE